MTINSEREVCHVMCFYQLCFVNDYMLSHNQGNHRERVDIILACRCMYICHHGHRPIMVISGGYFS